LLFQKLQKKYLFFDENITISFKNIIDDNDVNSLKEVPDVLKEDANRYLSECNSSTQLSVNKIINENKKKKNKYICDLIKTWDDLINEIRSCFENKTQLNFTLLSFNKGPNKMSLDNWRKYEQGKASALSMIERNLKEKGWDPKISCENPIYDDHYGYNGDMKITINCNFQ